MLDTIPQPTAIELSEAKEHSRQYQKEYYQRNKEHNKERRKQNCKDWYEQNKERVKERNKEWRLQNKESLKEYSKEYNKEWRVQNKERIKEYNKEYRQQNKESIKERSKEYLKKYRQQNKESIKEHSKEEYQRNKETLKQKRKLRLKIDPLYRAKSVLRTAVWAAFNRIKQNKPTNTEALLGCTWEEARQHFESKFLPGMNWLNHGEWHIDHIKPVSSFTESDLHLMNHISNLQPLWAEDNFRKGDKY